MIKWIAHLKNEEEGITMTSVEYDTLKEAEKFAKKITKEYEGFTKWKIYSSKNGVDKPVTERIKTYEDACAEVGIEPMNEEVLVKLGFTGEEIARRKVGTIAEALNEGWVPNWNDTDEPKYYPYFNIKPNANGAHAGLSFSFTYNAVSTANAYFGSRLCFKTLELARYAGETFTELYTQFLIK